MKSRQLTPTMYRVLKMISDQPLRFAPYTVYGDAPGYNARSAEALQARGLITVEPAPQNWRGQGFVITDAGRLVL